MKDILKNIVSAVAPTLGTALGGPLGGMASNVICEVLGCPNNPKAIEKAVAEATPEQMMGLYIFGYFTTTRTKLRSIYKSSLRLSWWSCISSSKFLLWCFTYTKRISAEEIKISI